MPKTIKFHNTPNYTREFVNNWITHMKKHKHAPAHVAVLEDVLQLIDIALNVLEPVSTDKEENTQS